MATRNRVETAFTLAKSAVKAYAEFSEACSKLAKASWTPEDEYIAQSKETLEAFEGKRLAVQTAAAEALKGIAPIRDTIRKAFGDVWLVGPSCEPSYAEAAVKAVASWSEPCEFDLAEPSSPSQGWLHDRGWRSTPTPSEMLAQIEQERLRALDLVHESRGEEVTRRIAAVEAGAEGLAVRDELSGASRRLLDYLYATDGRWVGVEELIDRVLAKPDGDERSLRVAIHRLRGALVESGHSETADLIESRRGYYRLNVDAMPDAEDLEPIVPRDGG